MKPPLLAKDLFLQIKTCVESVPGACSPFLLKACHIFEGKKRKNNIEVDFVDLFLFCNFV